LYREFAYQGARDWFTVPAGFSTDLASVPRLLWWLIPPFGMYERAAIIHDYLYVHRPRIASSVEVTGGDTGLPPITVKEYSPISRKDADGIFYRIMKEDGVWKPKAWCMWKAVAWFGWIVWNKRHENGKLK